MTKILVVDDEPNIREVVGLYLRRDGHEVILAADGEEALSSYRRERPDLVILDLGLPKKDGLEVCHAIRSTGGRRVPLIVLTARNEEEGHTSLDADDYVTKPFRPRELMARVAALLRREGGTRTGAAPDDEVLVLDGLRMDPGMDEVVVHDAPVILTAREFGLLYYLASHPGEAFTRDQLMTAAWDDEFVADTSTVTTHIGRLREKIETDPKKPRHLTTVWGVGYRFVA